MCVFGIKGEKKKPKFKKGYTLSKNTCDYNDDRLSTEDRHRIEFTIEPQEEKKQPRSERIVWC